MPGTFFTTFIRDHFGTVRPWGAHVDVERMARQDEQQ